MNIGFDLDKVLINYPPLIPSWIIDRLYKEKENGELVYRIPGIFEQQVRKLAHLKYLRLPIKKNVQALRDIASKGENTLFLISSRFAFLQKQTEQLTKRYKLNNIFSEMFFNYSNIQPHIFKNEVVKRMHIDRYIDDDLSMLKFLAKENPKTLFFWLNPKEDKKIAQNLLAVTSVEKIIGK